MPAAYYIEITGEKRTHIPAAELSVLKGIFGAPARSIANRASDLGIVSEHFSRSHSPRSLSKDAGRNQKHVVTMGENAKRFRLLLYRAVTEEIISTSKAAELGNMRVADLRDELAKEFR